MERGYESGCYVQCHMDRKGCGGLGVDTSGNPQGDSGLLDPGAERGTMAAEHLDCTLCWSNLCGAVSWISGHKGHLKGQVALVVRSWWAVECSGGRQAHETATEIRIH